MRDRERTRQQRQDKMNNTAATIRECAHLLSLHGVRCVLGSQPHPNQLYASKGKTMIHHCGSILHRPTHKTVQQLAKALRELAV
jgi:hypothetical protein